MFFPASIEERQQTMIEHVQKIAKRMVFETRPIAEDLRVVLWQCSRWTKHSKERYFYLRRICLRVPIGNLCCGKLRIRVSLQNNRLLFRHEIASKSQAGLALDRPDELIEVHIPHRIGGMRLELLLSSQDMR